MNIFARLKSSAVAIVVTTVLLAAVGWLKLAYDHEHFFLQEKLATISGSTVKAKFRKPPARSLGLVVAFPSEPFRDPKTGERIQAGFFGQARVTTATGRLVEFEVSTNTVRGCNWLQRHGLNDAFAVSWPAEAAATSDTSKAEGFYELEISFRDPPPSGSSLWLSFVVLNKDRKFAKDLVVSQ